MATDGDERNGTAEALNGKAEETRENASLWQSEEEIHTAKELLWHEEERNGTALSKRAEDKRREVRQGYGMALNGIEWDCDEEPGCGIEEIE